jgi:hypothetical protein
MEEKHLIRLACLAAAAELENNGYNEKAKAYKQIAEKFRPLTEEESLIGY